MWLHYKTRLSWRFNTVYFQCTSSRCFMKLFSSAVLISEKSPWNCNLMQQKFQRVYICLGSISSFPFHRLLYVVHMTSIAMYFGGTSSVLDILQNHVNGWKEIFPNKSDYRLKEGVLKPVVLSILATSMLGLRQASYIRVPMFSLLQYVEY